MRAVSPEPTRVREAPRWLRWSALAGLGILLVIPLANPLPRIFRDSLYGEPPEHVAQEFFDALQRSDGASAQSYLAPPLKTEPAIGHWLEMVATLPLAYEIRGSSSDGTLAQVDVVIRWDRERIPQRRGGPMADFVQARLKVFGGAFEGKPASLLLRRTDAGWRVTDFRLPFASLSMGTVPFETPPAQAPTGFDTLAPISREEFEKRWRADAVAGATTAGRLLGQLTRQSGVSVQIDKSLDQLKQPVTVRPGSVSRLELLDAAATAAGLRLETAEAIFVRSPGKAGSFEGAPNLRDGPIIAGPPKVAHAGPFRILASHLRVFAPLATGQLRLRIAALDLPTEVRLLMRDDSAELLEVTIKDERGHSLVNEARRSAFRSPTQADVFSRPSAGPFLFNATVPLRDLYRGVDRLAVVRGAVRLKLPQRVESVEFSPPIVGERRAAGGGELELAAFELTERTGVPGRSARAQLILSPRGGFHGEVLVKALGESGAPLFAGRVTLGEPFFVSGVPITLSVKVVQTQTVSYPFEINDIPLPLQPEGPIALTFAPHRAPVEFAAVELASRTGPIMPSVAATAINHSNKPVEWVRGRIIVLDAAGKHLTQFEHLFHNGLVESGEPRVWLAAGGQPAAAPVAIALPLPSTLPESARRVEVKVIEVGFLDGSVWKP